MSYQPVSDNNDNPTTDSTPASTPSATTSTTTATATTSVTTTASTSVSTVFTSTSTSTATYNIMMLNVTAPAYTSTIFTQNTAGHHQTNLQIFAQQHHRPIHYQRTPPPLPPSQAQRQQVQQQQQQPSIFFHYRHEEERQGTSSDAGGSGGSTFIPHSPMSHQLGRNAPHVSRGKKKKGVRRSRCSSAEKDQCSTTSGTQKRVSSEMDDMEMELDFLRGECSTITIILSSLRSAFLRDRSDSFNNATLLSSSSPSSSSSSSLVSLSAASTIVATGIRSSAASSPSSSPSSSLAPSPSSSSSSRKQQSQRKADMEKEMRVGYDDLLWQVRQLEKKVDALERKIRQLSLTRNKKPKS